jgi:hypothetical protein
MGNAAGAATSRFRKSNCQIDHTSAHSTSSASASPHARGIDREPPPAGPRCGQPPSAARGPILSLPVMDSGRACLFMPWIVLTSAVRVPGSAHFPLCIYGEQRAGKSTPGRSLSWQGGRVSGVTPWQKSTRYRECWPINRSHRTIQRAYPPISVTSIISTIAYLPMSYYPYLPMMLSSYLHTSAIKILPFYCHVHHNYEYLKASCLFLSALLSSIKSKCASKWSVKSGWGPFVVIETPV